MRARTLPPSLENFKLLAEAIQKGDLVGMPTETVYGLAGDCFNPKALAKIFETKERPTFDPLIVHVGNTPSLESQGIEVLQELEIIDASKISHETRILLNRLITAFWPGPLTLILPKNQRIPDLATSGLPTVAVRMPAHPLAQALIQASDRPLAAPSANRFGRISPTTAQAVAEELGDRIDWILDGGDCAVGVESTILSLNPLNSREVRILRAGGLPKERIEEVLGFKIHELGAKSQQLSSDSDHPEAPGMLESHYAPTQPFLLLDRPLSDLSDSELMDILGNLKEELSKPPSRSDLTVAFLMLKGEPEIQRARISQLLKSPILVKSLSPKGDLVEIAHGLFSTMRELDASPVSIILVEPCLAKEGLGYAVSDRLKRASAKSRIFFQKGSKSRV